MTAVAELDGIRDLQDVLLAVLDSDELTPERKAEAAEKLVSRARAHPLPDIALSAISFVLEADLDELTTRDPLGDRIERQVLEMHRRGEHVCTRCLLPLPDPETVQGWRREHALASAWRDHFKKTPARTSDLSRRVSAALGRRQRR